MTAAHVFASPPLLSCIVAHALFLATGASSAQATEPPRIRVDELIARLEQTDPRFDALAAELDRAQAESVAAGLLANPALGYQREEVFPEAGGLADNFVTLSWPLEVSGRRGLLVEAAEAGVEASAAENRQATLSLVLGAVAHFHDAAAARLRVAALALSKGGLVELLGVVRSRAAAGEASGYDLARLELELAGYDELVAEATAELASARRLLAALAGEPGGQLDADDPLELPALPPEVDASLAAALANRGDVGAANHRAHRAERALAAAGRAWIPALELAGGLKTSALGDETALGYVAGVTLAVPLFDRGQAEEARAEAERRSAVAEERVLARAVALEVRAAHASLLQSIERARRHQSEVVPQLDALVRTAEVGYREGERPVFDLLDVYRAAREVRLREIELRREAKRSQVQLWRALGRRPGAGENP